MKKIIKTVLHTYSFDTSKEGEKEHYKKLRETLKGLGLEVFDSWSQNTGKARDFEQKIKDLDGKEVELETDFLFNNQWNTSENNGSLRLFDWHEDIFPNKNIKRGYWLVPTPEMLQARLDQKKCGYCGKRYNQSDLEWCNACLSSEHLTEGYLPLLKLYNIVDDETRGNDAVPDEVRNAWLVAQRDAGKQRIIEKIADAKNDIEKKRLELDKEEKALNWLLENDLFHLFENMIYYSHVSEFYFGWRTSIAGDDKTVNALKTFPFEYKIK